MIQLDEDEGIDPSKVVGLLVNVFGVRDVSDANRNEYKLAAMIAARLQECALGDVTVEESEQIVVDDDSRNDPTWTEEDAEDISLEEYYAGEEVTFSGGRKASLVEVKRAVIYYRSAEKGFRTLASMTSRFRFIREKWDLNILRKLERNLTQPLGRLAGLQKLSDELKKVLDRKIEQGMQLSTKSLREMALEVNDEHSYVVDFKASKSWATRFNARNGYCSRRVTSFVSVANHKSMERIKAAAEATIGEAKQYIAAHNLPLSSIANADQSGFLKELRSARTLAHRGAKHVVVIVQSKAAITHSYTIMPVLYADGRLGEKLFVVLQEAGGHFPPAVTPFSASNLHVTAGSSHIMTKGHMMEWLRSCVFDGKESQHSLILLDSWPAFKDHAAIASTVPAGKQAKVINFPPGSTGLVQPCDLFFFHLFKGFVRKMVEHVTNSHPSFKVHQRDNILMVLSAVFYQFTAPLYRRCIQYGFYRAGILDQHPGSECTLMAFIKCSHCDRHFCFPDMVEKQHRC